MINWRLYILSILLTVVMAAGATVHTSARDIPNPREVDDRAYVVNPDSILRETEPLDRLCRQLEDSCGVRLTLVVLDSVSEGNAFSLSSELFRLWCGGDQQRNTDVLIMVATGTDNIQIHTGEGIQDILDDDVCSDIYVSDIAPKLNKWGVHVGLQQAAERIIAICSESDNRADLMLGFRPKNTTPYWSYLLMLVGLVVIVVQCRKIYKAPRCPVCGRRMWLLSDTILRPNSLREGGEGVRHYGCRKHPDQKMDVPYTFLKKMAVTQFILWMLITFVKYFFQAFFNATGVESSSRGGGSYSGGHSSGGGTGGRY